MPPDTFEIILPLANPLQVTFVADKVPVKETGPVSVTEPEDVQLFASVTVTE